MSDIYQDSFYEKRHEDTLFAARTILSRALEVLPSVSSCIDLGCGVGTWLSVAREYGISQIYGFDGDWVPEKYLRIPKSCFTRSDLGVAFPQAPRVDLAICLEVAEHLPEASADGLVAFLTGHAQYVLFSAAPPGQTGDGHINEQWPDYWAKKFLLQNFLPMDVIRKYIWTESAIPFWYRQNIFLCVRAEQMGALHLPQEQPSALFPLPLVHPEMFERALRKREAKKKKKNAMLRIRDSIGKRLGLFGRQ